MRIAAATRSHRPHSRGSPLRHHPRCDPGLGLLLASPVSLCGRCSDVIPIYGSSGSPYMFPASFSEQFQTDWLTHAGRRPPQGRLYHFCFSVLLLWPVPILQNYHESDLCAACSR